MSETFRYGCPTETDMSVRNDRYRQLDAKMLWEMQKIAKEEDYKALKTDKNAKELEEFLSYYDFLQKQIVALKNRPLSVSLKGNKWISKEASRGT